MQNIRYQVCLGEMILFWQDTWVGDGHLASEFPDLFNCTLEKEAKVKSYSKQSGIRGQLIWCPLFRRNLREHESQFMSLLNLLRDIQIPVDGEDVRFWKALKSGSFSVTNFYPPLSTRTRIRCHSASIQKFKAPPGVIAFGWIIFQRRILTLDNLRRRGNVAVNARLMCLEDKETVDHLLLSRRRAVNIWNSVISWFRCNWVLPELFQDLFEVWRFPIGSPKGK